MAPRISPSIPRELRTRSPFENVGGFGRALAGWRAEREAGQQPLALLPPAHLLPLGDGQAGADVLRVHAAVEAVVVGFLPLRIGDARSLARVLAESAQRLLALVPLGRCVALLPTESLRCL